MSSTGSSGSTNYNGSSTIVRSETYRSHKSRDHRGDLIERRGTHGHTTTLNHYTGGYEEGAPSPNYAGHSYSSSRAKKSSKSS